MRFTCLSVLVCIYGCSVVQTGHRGIKTRFGEVIGEPLPEGLYFYNAFTTSIVHFPIQEQLFEGKTECYTKDTQAVDISFSINFRPDPARVGIIFKEVGMEYSKKIFENKVISSLKDTVGQYIADDLVSKRQAVAQAVTKELSEVTRVKGIEITAVNLTNLAFDAEYEKAVEAKAVAIQKSLESKNQTQRIEEEAKQKIITAEAEAKTMKVKAEAIAQNRSLIEWEAIKKWNGVLPQVTGNATPFVNIQNKDSK